MAEESNVIDLAAQEYLRGQRNASASVAQSFEDDPEKAAKSIQIGEQSGTDPTVVFGNFDNASREYRTTLTDSLIKNNHFLRDFINDNPIAAKVSHDDIGTLDAVSEALTKLGGRSPGLAPFYFGLKTLGKQGGIAEKAIESFKESFGPMEFGAWIPEQDRPLVQENIGWKTVALAGILGVEIPARAIGAGLQALRTTLYESSVAAGMPENEAKRLARDLTGMAEYQLQQTPGKGTGVPKFGEALGNAKVAERFNQGIEAARVAEPYILAGKEPPVGLHPLIDEMKKRQSELDLKNLDEATKEAQGSATRERAPQLFENYIKQHNDLTIGISADAVAELYGNKMPHAEDNLLGWVPNIEKQMYTALATGGDIEIPLSSWLARIDPENAKLLHDHIRVRRGGITKWEADSLSDTYMVEAYHGSPHDFEAFSMEKIGTGEGAQSYGHGLYFAEKQDVAKSYKEAGPNSYKVGGLPYDENNPIHFAAKMMDVYGRRGAIEHIKGGITGMDPILDPLFQETVRILESGRELPKVEFGEGSLYKVRIHAEKEHFLDWDKPLAEQPEVVQKALGQLKVGRDVTGQQAYDLIAAQLQQDKTRFPEAKSLREAASNTLREAGIPGIKYLDQGSRGKVVGAKIDVAGMEGTIRTREAYIEATERLIAQSPDEAQRATLRQAVEGERQKIEELRQKIDQAKKDIESGSYNFVLFDDSLIEIVAKNDQAVQAVRKSTKLEPLFERPKGWEEAEPGPEPFAGRDGQWAPVSAKVEAFFPKEFEPYAEAMIPLIEEELNRIVPKGVDFQGAATIRKMESGAEASGVYSQFSSQLPLITLALERHVDVIGIARHEAIHHLRAYGFFTDAEWATLEKAAKEERWIAAAYEGPGTSVGRRYKDLPPDRILEEAIADQFRFWERNPNEKTIAAPIFEKLRAFLERIWERIQALVTKNPEVIDIFKKIKTGEIGSREPTGPRDKRAFVPEQYAEGKQPELPGVTRQEDLRIFSTIAGWMNKEQYQKYQELIAKRSAEDADFQFKKAERIERKRQTQEWKAEETKVKAEVEGELETRPDIAAVEFFRTGRLYGEDTGTRPRINEKSLTPEQRALLPEKYQRRDGMDPADAAQLFGYPTFDDFAAKLRQMDDAIGKGSLRDHVAKLSAQEVERRMQERFGNLEENILREAQEHVISTTQLDLLHEETVALGMKTGSEMTFTKADFRKWAEERFNDAQASSVSMEKYLKEAGKAGREVELALLKGDAAEAFRQKQRQYIAMLLGEQAKKFEKEVERFEKATKRMAGRVVKGMDQAFVDWTQNLLAQADQVGKRSPAELREATNRSGFASLREFTDFHRADGWELFVDEGILEGKIKPVDQMTVQEFRELKESVDSLMHVGRLVKKINVAGEVMDFDAFKQTVVDNISSLPPRDKNKPVRWIYQLDAELTKMEEILKDLDLRQELGPLFNAIIRPMADAKHTEFRMLEKLTKDLKDIKSDLGTKWQRSLKDDIPQDFLTDPYDGALYDTSREHMINIMLNFGNRSNIEKFTRGYAGKDGAPRLEARLWAWFDQYANKADWEYVQNVWNIWESWRKDADSLYYDLSGVPPKWIEPQPISNKHGDFAGGYFPVIYDRLRSNLNLIEERKPSASDKGLFRRDYFRATPAASYAKERTGYIDMVEFQNPLDQAATRMQQTIHDIAFRRAVMEAGKIIYDRDIRAAIRKHYGTEYEKQLSPWLEQTANYYNLDERGLQGVNSWLRRARVALITHALGFNLKVIFSPATGLTNPADIFRYERGFRENRAEIMGKSRELEHTFRNIDRDYREQLEATIKGKRLDVWQAKAMQFAFYPTVKVDQFFREVTFYNEYNKAIQAGRAEGEAVALADSAVRERHGSGAVVDLPRIMRSNEAMKLATIFYGYFNTTYNWQRQIKGNVSRGEYMKAAQASWGAVIVPAIFGALLFNQAKESDSIFKTWGKAIPLQLLSTIPLAREFGAKFFEGQASRTPWTSLVDAAYAGFNDVRKKMEGKKVDKGVKHAANLIGLTASLPLGQIGRTGQFAYDVSTGRQRPRNIIEWQRGIIQGEARLKK